MKKGITILMVFILTSIVNHSFGQAGNRDSSFAVNGIDSVRDYQFREVAVQADKKILALSDGGALYRFNKNGGLDNSFGLNGKVQLYTPSQVYTQSIAIQPDGKILIGGYKNSMIVVRLLSDGSLDNSFGTAGVVTGIVNSIVQSIIVQSNTSILLGISSYGVSNTYLVKLTSTGVLDNTFNTTGIVTTVMNYSIGEVCVQSNGKILIHGDNAIARYNSDGTLDQGFAVNGVYSNSYISGGGQRRMVVLPTGSILFNAGVASNEIVMLTPNGAIDNSFGTSGKVSLQGYASREIVVQPNGKIIVLGISYGGFYKLVANRFNPNGAIDNSFGTGGTIEDSLFGGRVIFNSAVLQSDEKLIIAGNSYFFNSSDSFPCVARYNLGVFSSDSVWPGDADHNGIADNNDLLPIGVAYGLGGPVRTNGSIVWQAEACQDWGLQLLSGANAKHVDCNGNGTINADDTLAIVQNFGLTHAKKEDQPAAWRAGIPGLNIVLSKDTVRAGDTLVASIQLGDASMPVSNIYGLAFTYNYDALVVDTTKTEVLYPSSWLATTSERITIIKDFKTTSQIKTAVTRINHINRSGNGEIAQIKFKITTDNISGKNLMYHNNVNFISTVTAIDSAGNPIDLNAGVDSALVEFTPTGIRTIEQFQAAVYPNPTSGKLFIKSDEALLEHVTLRNLLGETIVSEVATGSNKTIDVSGLANGVYIVHLETNKGELYRRIVISK